VEERGRAWPMAVLCDACWNVIVRDLAEEEGATDPPVIPDPDDVTLPAPPICSGCGAEVLYRPTNYGRWVCLALYDAPAKDVEPRYRWRLENVPGRHTSVTVDVVAVRLRGIEPLPGELVRPAHRAVCGSPLLWGEPATRHRG
jgi:hypothetical protein